MRASADVLIICDRNPNPPVFTQSSSTSASIRENYPEGGLVLSVNATDIDQASFVFLQNV